MTRYRQIPVIITMLLLMLSGCGSDQELQTEERIIAVKGQLIERSDQKLTRTYTGSIQGEKQAVMWAKISEVVDKVAVSEGQQVSLGQLLIVLDREGSSSQYRQASSVYLTAEKNFKKMEKLFAEGAISEAQYDGARTEYEVSQASFEAARQLVEIESPINGIVTSLSVSAGDYLNPGQELVTVASTDRLRIKFEINVDEVQYINEGESVNITADGSNTTGVGQVVSVARSANPRTRSVQVEVLIDNSDGAFHPGMFARVEVLFKEISSVIIIPRSAVIELDQQPVVFTVVNSIAARKDLTLGVEFDGQVAVDEGLNVGDTLVTVGQNYLEEGIQVNLISMAENDQ